MQTVAQVGIESAAWLSEIIFKVTGCQITPQMTCVLSILGSLFEKHIQKDHIQDNK